MCVRVCWAMTANQFWLSTLKHVILVVVTAAAEAVAASSVCIQLKHPFWASGLNSKWTQKCIKQPFNRNARPQNTKISRSFCFFYSFILFLILK